VRSVLRILFIAAIAILILFLGATAVIRQPLLTHRKPTADTLDYARMAKVIDGVFEAAISF
jgi:hypothetical protein